MESEDYFPVVGSEHLARTSYRHRSLCSWQTKASSVFQGGQGKTQDNL